MIRYNPIAEDVKRIMADGQERTGTQIRKLLKPGLLKPGGELSGRLAQWAKTGLHGIYKVRQDYGSPFVYRPQKPEDHLQPVPTDYLKPPPPPGPAAVPAAVPVPNELRKVYPTVRRIVSVTVRFDDGSVITHDGPVPDPVVTVPDPEPPAPVPPAPDPVPVPEPKAPMAAPAYRNMDDAFKAVMAKGDGWTPIEIKSLLLSKRDTAWLVQMKNKNYVGHRLNKLASEEGSGFMYDEELKRYHYLGED